MRRFTIGAWRVRGEPTLTQLLEELRDMRRESAAQFRELENKYVLQQVWTVQLRGVHDRQDSYQRQTDELLKGVEDEMQKLHHDAARIASQRHSDRITYAGWLLTALALPIVFALLTGAWQP